MYFAASTKLTASDTGAARWVDNVLYKDISIVFIVEVEGLIAKLTLRPKAEMLIRVNAEAEGRGINER